MPSIDENYENYNLQRGVSENIWLINEDSLIQTSLMLLIKTIIEKRIFI